MAEVTIEVGGRRYDVTCRDGEESQLRQLAALVDEKAVKARAAVGGVNEARQLLMAALLLADELNDHRQARLAALPEDTQTVMAEAVEQLAQRVESLAWHLEHSAVTP